MNTLYPDGNIGPPPPSPAWNLPATINVPQSGSVDVRQYLANGGALTISVTNLPTGVTYNSGTESLEGAASGTSSGTATFTAGSAVDTATVALVEGGSTLRHGDLVTLPGAGFGARPDYNTGNYFWNGSKHLHFRFKDFRDGLLSSDGFYPQAGGGAWTPGSELTIQSDSPPANSPNYLRRVYISRESGGLSFNASGAGDTAYTSFKFRVDAVADQQSGKFFRSYANNSKNLYLSTGGGNLSIRGYAESITGGDDTQWSSVTPFTANRWERLEVLQTKADNKVRAWLNGELVVDRTWLDADINWNGHTFDFPNMIDAPDRGWPANGFYDYADIFSDWTAARVEMAISPNWAEVNEVVDGVVNGKEIQPVVSWENSAVQIRVNRGELAIGTDVWFFVIGQDNAPIGTAIGPYVIGE